MNHLTHLDGRMVAHVRTVQEPSTTAQADDTTTTSTTEATTTTASTTTTTTAAPTTTTTASTTTSSSSSTSTSTASTTTTTTATTSTVRSDSGSASSGASLALAGALLAALVIGGGWLLWRARQNALARKALTGKMSEVVAHAQTILAWLTAQDAGPDTTPPMGLTPIDDVHQELTTLLAQISGARRAATPDDEDIARTVLTDLDRATRNLVRTIDPDTLSAFRVTVARARGWLDAD